ncbi:MAG: phosphocholine cytidylyltransferase family protein [Dehalococcoidia bacterium]|nr:phosphocholine cytidylyltransferase family protein [Dehalococcoidia bacterium]
MRAVVLAAGLGGRLRDHTAGLPKPLLPVAGRPLISYTLDALAAAGVDDAIVVTGYREAAVRAGLSEAAGIPLRFATNPRYHRGASYSLAAAREACGAEPFLLVMCDHLLGEDLLGQLAAADPADGVLVAADSAPRPDHYVDEATRLLVEDGAVRDIGKGLESWNALDTGAFHCSPAAWEALDAAPEDANLSDVFRTLVPSGRFRALDVTGAFWYDVDTPEDYEAAELALQQRPAPLA